MQNILVFYRRDWLHPKAGPIEHYVHEICRRVAGQGYFVSLICQRHPYRPFRSRRVRTERVDGIQIARLGPGFLYTRMARTFLADLSHKSLRSSRHEVVIECISGRRTALADCTNRTVIPLIFRLDATSFSAGSPPRPIIAATEQARTRLIALGVPPKHIVYAPLYGTQSWDMPASLVLATIENLQHEVKHVRRSLARSRQEIHV